MTEQEWLALDSIQGVNGGDFVGLCNGSNRKLFLLAAYLLPKFLPVGGCDVCRAHLPLFEEQPDRGWQVEGWQPVLRAKHPAVSGSGPCESRRWFRDTFQFLEGNLTQTEWWNKLIDIAWYLGEAEARRSPPAVLESAWRSYLQHKKEVFREGYGAATDILGNPFRPAPVAATWLAWNEACVVRLAQSIYDDRSFEDMPVLADALEDAGCDCAGILSHCREPVPHVRGCWVVDLVLGKA